MVNAKTISSMIKYILNKKVEDAIDKEIIFIVEEDPEIGFNAKALGFPIFTQGDTMEELKKNIKDAISCHFDEESEIPKVIRLHMAKEEVLAYA